MVLVRLSVESKQNFFDFQVSAVLATTELREGRGFATSLVSFESRFDWEYEYAIRFFGKNHFARYRDFDA